METLEHALKQVYNRFAKRRKVFKLAPAVAATILLCVFLSGLIVVNVKSLYQTSSTISSFGTLKAIGIEVYKDEDLTNKATMIKWGLLTPGTQKTQTVYVSNKGNLPVTLYLSVSNWSPTFASNYLTLTWSYANGQTLNAGDFAEVTLTLTVSPSVTGISSFNFDVTAEGRL